MTDAPLTDDETTAVREAVAAAVLDTPAGLGAALEDEPLAYLRLVAATRVAAEESSRLLREAIAAARAAGHSWDAVGRVLGVSRQAAQQRFGTPTAPEADGGSGAGPARRVLTPVTAFTEMAVLEEEGRYGWHCVDYGASFLVVAASPWQWEHRRVSVVPGQRRRLEQEGWERVRTMWFPWAYYARRLDAPAEPDLRTG